MEDMIRGIAMMAPVATILYLCWDTVQIRRKRRKRLSFWRWVLSVYLLSLLYGTLLNRIDRDYFYFLLHGERGQLEWVMHFPPTDMNSAIHDLYNVALFFPWGLLLPICQPKMRNGLLVVASGIAAVLCIETMQYLGSMAFSLNDILTNGAGMIAGYVMYAIGARLCRRK